MHEQQSSQSNSSLGSSVDKKAPIRIDDHRHMVAEAEYLRALHPALQDGYNKGDRYRAEKEIDAAIAKIKAYGLYSYYCIKHTSINVINEKDEMVRHSPNYFKGDDYEIK